MKRTLCVFMGVLVIAISLMTLFGGRDITDSNYIKYVEFNVTKAALQAAVDLDVSSQGEKNKLDFITLLAYLGAKYGGDFSKYKYSDMTGFEIGRASCRERV